MAIFGLHFLDQEPEKRSVSRFAVHSGGSWCNFFLLVFTPASMAWSDAPVFVPLPLNIPLQVTVTKTDHRNKLAACTLEAILHVV